MPFTELNLTNTSYLLKQELFIQTQSNTYVIRLIVLESFGNFPLCMLFFTELSLIEQAKAGADTLGFL